LVIALPRAAARCASSTTGQEAHDVTDTPTTPLEQLLPEPQDRKGWHCTAQVMAADTQATVFVYEHLAIGRALRLDADGRVYGQDPEGTVRLFGRGGPLALAVALNALYDGRDEYRPARVVIPQMSPTG
jgi:hypothetical protein